MAYAEIIIGVAYFLQVCWGQVNNGEPFNQNLMTNTLGEPEKGSLQSTAKNANFRGNYINFEANNLSQNKFSQKRLSELFNQKPASPLYNYQNTIFARNPNQQQFSNLPQQNVETQNIPNVLANWQTRQDPNLTNIKLTPPNELQSSSNILPAPNIANNFMRPPSLTISTSLPSIIPSASPMSNYIQLQSKNQVYHDTSPNKVFLALGEPPKAATSTTNSGNYYYIPPKPSGLSNDVNRHKSLNMNSLLSLILNILNDKNEDCPCCCHCHRCNKNNLAEIPLIDSGYSKQIIYGPPSEESYEDSESEEEIDENDKLYNNQSRKRKHHRHNSEEEKERQSNED